MRSRTVFYLYALAAVIALILFIDSFSRDSTLRTVLFGIQLVLFSLLAYQTYRRHT